VCLYNSLQAFLSFGCYPCRVTKIECLVLHSESRIRISKTKARCHRLILAYYFILFIGFRFVVLLHLMCKYILMMDDLSRLKGYYIVTSCLVLVLVREKKNKTLISESPCQLDPTGEHLEMILNLFSI
jgi:hypothetical protein